MTRVRHPRLAAAMAAGGATFLAGLAVARTADRLLGLRIAFLGGVVFVFGASAALALSVQRRIDGLG